MEKRRMRRAIERKRASVQPKLAVDGLDFGRLDQPRMGHRDREQWSLKLFQPKIEELVENGEIRAEIVLLPDVGLQQEGMIRKPVQDVRRRQSVAFNLPSKIVRNHGVL